MTSNNNYVYVHDKEQEWVPARLISSNENKAIVEKLGGGEEHVPVDLSEYKNKVLPLQNVDQNGKLKEVDDMVNLPYLHEAAILYNLKERHNNSEPYTRTGDILMAVNPYEWINTLYTQEKQKLYTNELVGKDNGSRNTLSPHVYEVSALAYKGLISSSDNNNNSIQNQSILVSGESGAGKTETVKICLDHIASIQQSAFLSAKENNNDDFVSIVKKVEDSNPVLEAFGNAKTRRNDNSSRFGKYLQLQFTTTSNKNKNNDNNMQLIGSTSQVYLLETNRVVRHDQEERTFHIFYQLLAAPDKIKERFWKKLIGKTANSFKYVGESTTKKIEGKSDFKHFVETLKTLASVGIRGKTLRTLMQTLCVILQLGNIEFTTTGTNNNDNSLVSTINELKYLAELMGIPKELLISALTQRTMTTKNESYTVPLSVEFAEESRDALAKELYHKAFTWIVNEINTATKAEPISGQKIGTISLLDIFGFESFQSNGFEQLCINYANEKLQQKFTNDIFRDVQTEYEFEGISLHEINYNENSNVVDLIESPMGLMAMLNEECVRPKGNDREFVYKAVSENRKSTALIVDNKFNSFEFGIRHYCADVVYDATGFVNKNNDTLATDLQECIKQSKNTIIASDSNTNKRGSNLVGDTVWTKYRDGLTNLMKDLEETQSRYIRCIKPNHTRQPKVMDNSLTLDQLRSAGVVAAITISRSAFPNRVNNQDVWDRFRSLFPKGEKKADSKTQKGMVQNIETILSNELSHMEETQNGEIIKAFAIGKTRTYFRAGALEYLESERFKGVEPAAIKIQSAARRFLVRSSVAARAALRDEAAATIQAVVRRKLLRQKPQSSQTTSNNTRSKKIESLRRIKAAREKRKRNKAATTIQAIVRGGLQRPKFQIELKEYREMQSMKEQIELLKQKLAKSEEETQEAVKEAEKRITQAIGSEEDDSMDSAEVEHVSLKAKLEESEKVIEFLRRERKRLMGVVKTHKDRCERVVTAEHKPFQDSTKDILSRVEEIRNFMKVLEDNKETLAKNRDYYADQIKEYRKQIQVVQSYKQNQDDLRALIHDGVARIVTLVQEECKDDDLVEDIYLLAMECGDFADPTKDGDDDLDDDLDDLDNLDDLDDLSDCELEQCL